MRLLKKTCSQPSSPIGNILLLKNEYLGRNKIIDLTQGLPIHYPNSATNNKAAKKIFENETSCYTARNGIYQLRELWAKELNSFYKSAITESQILVTSGCNNAFAIATTALFDALDEVILSTPYYFNHKMWLEMSGVKINFLDTTSTGYLPAPEKITALLNNNIKAIILTSPSNPTGVSIPADIMSKIMEICVAKDLILIIDETYKSYGENRHNLFDNQSWDQNLISLHSLSKDFALCGYRIGCIIGGEKVLSEMQKVSECLTVCPSHIGQIIAIASLQSGIKSRNSNVKKIIDKATYFKTKANCVSTGFSFETIGAFFAWVKYSYKIPPDEMIRKLAIDYGILTLPGYLFTPFDKNYIRLCYSRLSKEDIDTFFYRLNSFRQNG
jgi:aspartate/methionine/tyrosine aminotransferase